MQIYIQYLTDWNLKINWIINDSIKFLIIFNLLIINVNCKTLCSSEVQISSSLISLEYRFNQTIPCIENVYSKSYKTINSNKVFQNI